MSENGEILRVLLEIKGDIGALKQDMASSISQRTLLFSEVNGVKTSVASLETSFESHVEDERQLLTKISAVEKDIAENVKPVIAPFRDAKTKGMMVLAAIALMGGTAGGQAEKLLHLLLGR